MHILKAWAMFGIQDSKLCLHALGKTDVSLQETRKISLNNYMAQVRRKVSFSHSLDLYRDR